MGHHRSGRAAGGLVTVAAVTLGLAVSLGAGYTVADAALSDSSANVAKGSSVAHVNGESRRVDALSKGSLARRGEGLVVTTLPSGQVVAINQKTNTVTTLDGGTMSPTSTVRPARAGQVSTASSVVVSGDNGWLIDYDGSAVRRLDNGEPQDPVKLDSPPVDAAPSSGGGVIVLTKAGALKRVDTADKVHEIDADDAQGAGLTVAGGHTYLVRTSGEIDEVDDGSPVKVAAIDGVAPGPDRRMVVGSLQGTGPHVMVVSSDVLGYVDPDDGRPRRIALKSGTRSLGRPVEFAGKAYIPDYSEKHRVLVVDLRTNELGTPIKVPGTEKQFALFVSGGKLWANDQYAQHLLVFDKSGKEHQVDKGDGDGTKDETRKPPRTGATGSSGAPPATDPTGSSGNGGGKTSGTGDKGGQGNGPGPGKTGGTGTEKPKLVTVPPFPPGTDYQDACDRIQELGPSCNPVSREDDSRPSDELLETHPGAGKKVAEDGEVTVVFVGPTAVPALPQNATPQQACDLIESVKLTCKLAADPKPTTDPGLYGTVSGTDPPANAPAKTGDEITASYYDQFTMPDFNGTSGTESCARLNGRTLEVPGRQAITVQCAANPGQGRPKDQPNLSGVVYHQSTPANTTFKPAAGSATVTLDIYKDQSPLKDYPGTHTGADQAATDPDCTKYFNCSVSDQSDPAVVNGQAQPTLVGTVARMTDENNNNIGPGDRQVGATVKMVRYRDSNDVPDTTGLGIDDACGRIQAQGFQCIRAKQPAKGAAPNVVYQQDQKGSQPIGSTVTVRFYPAQLVLVHKYVRADGHGGVHYLSTGPAPNGTTSEGDLGYAYATGSTGINNWGLYQQTGQNCTASHPGENVIYTHHTDSSSLPGCGGGYTPSGTVADLWYPGESTQPVGADTCGYGMVWLYRVVTFNSRGDRVHTYQLGGPDKAVSGENESIGCMYAP